MKNAIVECERAGHAGGLADGLALALDGADACAAPGAVAALPLSAVPAGAVLIPHGVAAGEGIAFVRAGRREGVRVGGLAGAADLAGVAGAEAAGGLTVPSENRTTPTDADSDTHATSDAHAPAHAAVALRLGAVRIGVTRWLMEQAAAHLADRVVGGEPTLSKQLVQAALADALVTTEAARRCLLVSAARPAVVADVHDRLTAADWELAKLLGASGYVGRNPATRAYVSRLTANCWVSRGGTA